MRKTLPEYLQTWTHGAMNLPKADEVFMLMEPKRPPPTPVELIAFTKRLHVVVVAGKGLPEQQGIASTPEDGKILILIRHSTMNLYQDILNGHIYMLSKAKRDKV